jgi:hypothetical protein
MQALVLGIRLIAERDSRGLLVLSFGYAALVMSHLPSALLATATVIPAYVLYRARDPAALLWCAAGGALGAGLAAVYLIPALTLQEWISADAWWVPRLRPENWFLFAFDRWPDPVTMQAIAAIALGAALFALGAGAIWARMPRGKAWRSEVAFWITIIVVCLALMAGIVPWVWQIDVMAKTQFPWRLSLVVEFAVVTALCLGVRHGSSRTATYFFVAAVVALVPAYVQVMNDAVARFDSTQRAGALDQRDMKPHQPRGFPQNPETDYAELGLERVAGVPTIECRPATTVCRAEPQQFGGMRVEIEGGAPTTVTVRRFYFPAWHLAPAATIVATDPFRLVSFVAPAGRNTFRLGLRTLPAEQWGWCISTISLVLLWLVMIRGRRKSASAQASPDTTPASASP